MAVAGMKLSLDDRDRDLVLHLTEALGALAQELKRYNDGPPVTYAEASKPIIIPQGAGDYSIGDDGVIHHQYGGGDPHTHQGMAELLNCLTARGIL